MNISDMHFNKWNIHAQQSIPYRDASTRERTRIDYDCIGSTSRGTNAVNQMALVL